MWKRFKKNKPAIVALIFIIALFATAIFAPIIAPDPGVYDLTEILAAPSHKHILGTDSSGSDVFSQIIWGGRVSLSVGFVAVGIALLVGVFLGAIAGYFGGFWDIIISRFIEVMMCFPAFFLILAVLAFIGPSIYNVMIVIGLTSWTGIARLTRAEFLKLKNMDFVMAAKAMGASHKRIILKHILPNSLSIILVSATFGIGSAILAEAALSFLGFGTPPSTPSWGSLLSQAQDFMDIAWWLTLVPGLAIFLTVTAYNIVGEGLRDAMDVKSGTAYGVRRTE